MESEGPYGIKNSNHWWHVDGLGEEQRLNQWSYKIGAEWWARKLNAAHAEGRKSMEKDFKELLELANSIENIYPGRYEHVERFKAWKKARGIE